MKFNSIGRSSNFAQAGKSAADETVRAFAASRRNAPKYDKLAEDAVNMRSKEKIAAMKAEQEVALAGIKAKSDVKSYEIKNQAMMKRDKAKRKAGALGVAGKLFGTAGEYLGEKRTKREVGSEDAWYDSQIQSTKDSYKTYADLLNDDGTLKDTSTSTSNTGDSDSGKTTSSTDTTGGGTSTNPISSFQASGKTGKYSVDDMTQLALGAGFTPEQAKIMGAIGFAESGGRAGIDTVQSGLDPNKSNEYSVGLFQVNAQAHGDKLAKLGYTADDLRDPQKAAQVAKMVYDEVGSFKPWSVYKSGAYQQYLQ